MRGNMKKKIVLLMLCMGLLLAGCNTAKNVDENIGTENNTEDQTTDNQAESEPEREPVTYRLVWSDEFDGEEIDTTKWDFQPLT